MVSSALHISLIKTRCMDRWAKIQERVKVLEEKVTAKSKSPRMIKVFDDLPESEVQGRLQHVLRKLRLTTTSLERRTKLKIKKSVLQRRLDSSLEAKNTLPPTELTANAEAVVRAKKITERRLKLKGIGSAIGAVLMAADVDNSKLQRDMTKTFGEAKQTTWAVERAMAPARTAAQDETEGQKAPFKAKSEPFEPFMNKKQEQRARMVALFEAVSPSKLVILDKLFNKRNEREDGFNQMWKSYKQKWGAQSVEEAFSKVRCEKKKFYRAKIVALFEANQPGKISEVDYLMAKHEGKYDQMFKRWVETKKFNAQAVTAAHTKAIQQLKR